jgi:MFS family permease
MRDAEITPKKYYRVMLFFSFAIAFLLDLLLFATAPMVTQIMGEMKLSHVDFGFLFSAAMISLLLFRIPWGLIGDRIGYLNVFRIALPISAASAILRGFSSNYSTLLMSQILLGFGLAAILPCLPLIVKEWASDRVLGFSTGIYVSGFALGNFTALGLTPQLLTIMGWKEILLIDGGLATLMALLWWVSAKSFVKTKSEFKLKDFTLVFFLTNSQV